MTAREAVLRALASLPIRDLEVIITKAQEFGADPVQARIEARDVLGLPKDRPGFTAIPAKKD